ncbi:hypothetical protein ES705_32404 [subsurface metagenome]
MRCSRDRGRRSSLTAPDGAGDSAGRSWNCNRWQFAPPLMRGAILCRRRAKRALERAVRRALGGHRGVLPPEPKPAPPAVQRACPKRRGGGPRRAGTAVRASLGLPVRTLGLSLPLPVDPVVGTQLGECPGVPPRDLGYAPQERGVRRGGRSERDVERGNAPRHAPGSLATGGGPHVSCDVPGALAPGTERPMAPRRGAGAGHLSPGRSPAQWAVSTFQIYFGFIFCRAGRVSAQAFCARGMAARPGIRASFGGSVTLLPMVRLRTEAGRRDAGSHENRSAARSCLRRSTGRAQPKSRRPVESDVPKILGATLERRTSRPGRGIGPVRRDVSLLK